MLIVLIIVVLGIGLLLLGKSNDYIWEEIGAIISIIGGFALIIVLFIHITVMFCAPLDKDRMDNTYNTIMYQIDSGFYSDESNGLGKYELISDIKEWNKEIIKYQRMDDSIWIGNLIPDLYTDYETIPLELVK